MSNGPDMQRYFAELAERAGTATITEAEAEAVLDLARVVAHQEERRLAQLLDRERRAVARRRGGGKGAGAAI